MSKSFTKVLTICSLVLVVMAIIVASAICLTTTVSYKVTVDAILRGVENLPDGANKDVVIKINGKEGKTYNAQKGEKITVEYTGLDNYNFIGWMKGQYLETAELSDKACSFEINADTKVSVVFDAHKFYQFNVGHTSDATVSGGKIDVKVEGTDFYGSNGVYQVKDGSEFKVSYTAVGYDFVNWGSADKTANPYVIEKVWGPQSLTAEFNAIRYNVKYGEQAQPVSMKYGDTLKAVADEYIISTELGNYWKTFEGWKIGNTKYDKAIFNVAKENRDITLTAHIEDQSQKTYSFKKDGTLLAEFSTKGGVVLNEDSLSKLQGHNEIVGFKVKGVSYALNEDKNNFVEKDDVYKNLTKVLADSTATDIAVEPVWELAAPYSETFTINVNTTYGENGQFTIHNEKLTIVKAPTRNYYKLTGIRIGGEALELAEDGNSFKNYDKLYQAIVAAEKTEENVLSAEAIWENTVKTTLKLGNGDEYTVENNVELDKEGSLAEFLAANGVQVPGRVIIVKTPEGNYQFNGDKFDKCSVSDLLDAYKADGGEIGAEITLEIII